jgi:hypothetical protein
MALVDEEKSETRKCSEKIECLQAEIRQRKAAFKEMCSMSTGNLVRLDDELVSLRSALQGLEMHVSRKIEQV